MENKRLKRLITAFVVIVLALVIGIFSLVAYGSYQIAQLESSSKKHIDNSMQPILARLEAIEQSQINIEQVKQIVASLPKPKDGINGNDGIDGTDSISTHTVVEKETVTVIEKQTPGVDGKDAESPLIGVTVDGKWAFKYPKDRNWQLIPTVNIGIEL